MSDLDQEWADRARAAMERVASVERDLLVARADLQFAVRRLQLAGASVRAIGKTLGISHQRVQQLVAAADDGRGWRRRGRSQALRVCSFCGRDQNGVAKLIAGPKVHICDGCVAEAERAFAGNPDIGWEQSDRACRFCGRQPRDSHTVGRAEGRLCRSCLELSLDILNPNSPTERRGTPGVPT